MQGESSIFLTKERKKERKKEEYILKTRKIKRNKGKKDGRKLEKKSFWRIQVRSEFNFLLFISVNFCFIFLFILYLLFMFIKIRFKDNEDIKRVLFLFFV